MNAIIGRLSLPARPPHCHPLDPIAQHRAAEGFGKLVAQGLYDPDYVVRLLVDAALEAGYSGDLWGIRHGLRWTLRGSTVAWERARWRTEWNIRRAVAPLFEQWARPDDIRAAAARENAAAGEPLLPREIAALLNEEATRAKRVRRRRRYG